MLAAFSLYGEKVYYLPNFVSDSLRLPPLQAIMLIQEGQFSQLEDPVDFFQLFGITMENIVSVAGARRPPAP